MPQEVIVSSPRLDPEETIPTPTAGLLPATDEAAQQAIVANQLRRAQRPTLQPPALPTAEPSPQQRQGMEGDIPIDITEGLPAWERFWMETHRSMADQERYLRNKYPIKVRLNPQGRWVVRVIDKETEKPKDVVVNPLGIEPQDATAVIASVPEMIGELLPLITRRPNQAGRLTWAVREFEPGVLNAAKTLAASAGGGQAMGGLQDIAIRTAEGVPIDVPEILEARKKLGLLNFTVGGAAGVGTKIFTTLASPFSNVGVAQLDFRKAREFFKPMLGDVPGTPYELTGSVFLGNIEEFLKKRPAGAVPFKGLTGEQERAFTRVQNVALGLQPDAPPSVRDALIPTAEDVGQSAVRTLRGEVGETEFPIERARFQTIRTGTEELAQSLGINPAGKVNIPVLGGAFRSKAVAERKLFFDTRDDLYEKFYSHPLALEKNISVADTSKTMRKLKDEMPSKIEVTEVPSVILDQFGRPVAPTTITGKRVEKEWVPPGVLSRMDSLIGLKGDKMALNELKQMRTDVANAIAEGEAIPGTKTGYLKKISSELSNAIESGLNQINDPTLTKAWRDATAYNKANADRFQDMPIARLFKTERQGGGIGDIEIVETIRRGGPEARDTYNSFKNFFGANSLEFQSLQTAIKDDLFGRSYEPLYEAVDAQKFLKAVKSFTDENPEMADEILGPVAKELQDIGASMGVAQGKIEYKDLQNALTSPKRSVFWMQELVSAEKKKAQKYTNDLIARAAKGEIEPDQLAPSEFVGRFLSQASPPDIKGVMQIFDAKNPVAAQGLRQSAVYDLLRRATPSGGKFQTPFTVRGVRLEPSAVKLQELITDEVERSKLTELLGKSGMDTLDNYVKLMAPTQTREKFLSSAGGISSGMQLAQLISFGLAKYMGEAARNWLESGIITSPTFRSLIGNTLFTPERAAQAVNMVAASAPFVANTISQFGEEVGIQMMEDMKRGINGFMREIEATNQRQPAGPTPKREVIVTRPTLE